MTIDIEGYLMAMDSDNVCGEVLEYDAEFIELEQAVIGKQEHAMGDAVIEAEPPNWQDVLRRAEKLLTRTRDLRVLVNYLRALLHLQGFQGLSEGMELLKCMIERRWQDIHPQLDSEDNNDPTERINILMMLCDFDSFLKPLQKLPLVESKTFGSFNLRDIQHARGVIAVAESEQDELPGEETIAAAFQDCNAELLLATHQAVSDSLQSLDQIESFITDHVTITDAASFTELRVLLKEIDAVLAEQIEKKGLQDIAEEITADGLSSTVDQKQTAMPQNIVSTGINNNQDVIKALNLICEYYTSNEPSSPIPLLLERVVRLVGKNFMEVLKDVAPNGVEQVEFLSGLSNHDTDNE